MNLRHIVRTNIRLNLDVIQATLDCLDRDLEKSLIFAAISAANVGHLDDDPILAKQYVHASLLSALRRPIPMQRVADSLGLPRETTRVKVRLLMDAGLVQRTTAGLLIPAEAMQAARFEPMMQRYLAAIDRAVERLAAAECVGLTRGERLHPFPSVWDALRFISQHVLRGTVDLRFYTSPASLLGSYLFLAMADATSSRFSEGPDILFADDDDAPPDWARATISASALAARLAMPRETVRRNLKALVEGGWLSQDRDGFGLLTGQTAEDRQREQLVQERSRGDLNRLVRKLRSIGAIVRVGQSLADPAPST